MKKNIKRLDILNGKLLIIPVRTGKMVPAFDYVTGNPVNRNYIPANNPNLQMSECWSLK
ncbi:MAG: hypothetical protein NTV87_05470 [Ignavibacteriae bacterium]|nr:hypothetical protein [Ignavibacteriota bacterium]